MDFSAIPLFNLMKVKLNYMSERQSVLAQNIANADTPGYRTMDVPEPDFKKMISGGQEAHKLQMTLTNPMDMRGTAANAGAFQPEPRQTTGEQKPDGNNVVIEEEMSKIALNQADYQKVLDLYTKTIAMFKTAIGSAGSGG